MQWAPGGPRVDAPPCALEHATMGAKRRTTRFGGARGGENRSSVRDTSGSRRVRRLKRPSTDPSRERAGRTLCAVCPQLLVALPEVRRVASFLNPSGRDSVRYNQNAMSLHGLEPKCSAN